MTATAATTHGCMYADCGYKTLPSTMGTPYKRCPLCGGPWVADPPPQAKTTGRTIVETHNGHETRKIIVRPHLRSLYEQIGREKEGKDAQATPRG